MATCSDCVHIDVCENRFSWLEQEDNTKHITCHHFKNKADVAEVVRCKECIYNPSFKRRKGYVWCRKFSCDVHSKGFCSYGERKTE